MQRYPKQHDDDPDKSREQAAAGADAVRGARPFPCRAACYLASIALALGAFGALGGHELVSFESFARNRAVLASLIADHYPLTVALFMGAIIAAAAAGLPGSTPLTFLGGFLFGFIGVLYSVTATTCGAVIAFTASRFMIGRWLQRRFAARLSGFNREFAENGPWYVLGIRMTPFFPSVLVNLLAGMTTLPLRTFILITAMGVIPNSLAYTFAGRQLGLIDAPVGIISPPLLAALAVIALLALLPVAIRKLSSRVAPPRANRCPSYSPHQRPH